MGVLRGSDNYAGQAIPKSYMEGPCKRDFEREIKGQQVLNKRDEDFKQAILDFVDAGGCGVDTLAMLIGELTFLIRGRHALVAELVRQQEKEGVEVN